MGIYHVHTLTTNRGVTAVWKCSKCGKTNIGFGIYSASASYNDKGVLTNKGLAKRENATKSELDDKIIHTYYSALTKSYNGDYSDFNLTACKCAGCGNAEPWSIGKSDRSYKISRLLYDIFKYFIFFITIFFVYCLTDRYFSRGLLYADIAVSIIALGGLIYSKNVLKKLASETLRLPQESIAKIYKDVESLKEECDLLTEEEKASL